MQPLKDELQNLEMRRISSNPSDEQLPPEDICPHCNGMGLVTRDVPVNHPDFGKAFPCVCQTEKMDQRRENRLRKISNMDAYARFRFDNFHINIHDFPPNQMKPLTDAQESNLVSSFEIASEFAQQLEGWILFHGAYGCGKTHLAAAIGNYQLHRGHEVIFVTVPDLLDHLRATYAPSSDVTYDELFEKVRNTRMLILDDLGTESPTPWAVEKLYQLLNHRYTLRLPTVITTNHRAEDIDGRIRSRIFDDQITRIVNMSLPDFRLGGAKQLLDAESTMLSNLRLYNEMTFQTFMRRSGLTRDQDQSLHQGYQSALNFAQNPMHRWLILYGEHGCGKTHLAAAIANHRLNDGYPVFLVTVADLLDHLRAAFGEKADGGPSLDQRFQEIRSAPLLILDDFNPKTGSTWAQEKLFQIIDYRHLARLSTVITVANDTLKNLPSRFLSRFQDTSICTFIEITAPAYQGGISARSRR